MSTFGSFRKINATNVIFDSVGTTLTAHNSDGAFRQLDTKIENVTASGSAGGSSPGVQPQIVAVNPNIDEIEGECYHTWAAADSYIQTQTVDANHRWAIKIDGSNSENIVMKSYVSIVGTPNNTILTGQLSSDVTFSFNTDTTSSRVENCIVTNIHTTRSMEFIQFHNCNLSGGSPTLGYLQVFNGAVSGGNYDGLAYMELFDVMIVGGVFTNQLNMVGGELYNNFTVHGGKFKSVYLSSAGSGVLSLTTPTVFERCRIETNISTSSQQLTLDHCTFDSNPTITIDSGGSLFTYGLSSNFNVAGYLDNWHNVGSVYRSPVTGFSASNTQEALDKIVSKERLFINISSANGTLNIDLNAGSYFKTTMTEHANVQVTNLPSSDVAKEVVLIVQQSSGGTQYSLQWPGYICEGSNSPDITNGEPGANYIYRLYVFGSTVYAILVGANMYDIP